MWIVKLALTRPYTFIVFALLIFVLSPLVILRTPTDIFPNIDIPVISVAWTYTGLNPEDIEGRLTTPYEKVLTTLVDNIEHIESTSYNGVAVIKIFLQPHTSVDLANSQVVGASQFALRLLPSSIQPPEIMNFSASSVPILQLGLSGQGLSEQQLNDLALNFVRTQMIRVPGAVIPLPYGVKQRQVGKLRVYISVPEVYASAIKSGETVTLTLDAFPGENFVGTLERDSNSIDLTSRTLRVEVDVDNLTGSLLPGAYAFVHWKLPSAARAVTIPTNTLLFRAEGLRVAVVRGGQAKLVPVTIGHDYGSSVEVLSGLTSEDAVILDPSDSIMEGSPVKIAEAAKPEGSK
jgi:multidrug efflux pump subunit AcrA (membrane-fusion protein)